MTTITTEYGPGGLSTVRTEHHNVLQKEELFVNEKIIKRSYHCPTDGPAYTLFNSKNGNVRYEAWYFEGELHRDDGPAKIHYGEDGKILSEEWFISGIFQA